MSRVCLRPAVFGFPSQTGQTPECGFCPGAVTAQISLTVHEDQGETVRLRDDAGIPQ
jgi:hypothetical protein